MHHRDHIHRDTPAIAKMETHDHTTKKRGKSLKIESVKIAQPQIEFVNRNIMIPVRSEEALS